MPPRSLPSESPASVWDVVIRVSAVAAFSILAACLIIPLRPRFADYGELKQKGLALEAERTAVKRDIERREAELLMLERDPAFIEIKARDRLDMCQQGEVVFRFDGDPGD